MGKLKMLGIVAGVVVGAFLALIIVVGVIGAATAVNGSGVPGATVDSKYSGLTQKQITGVKIWKERCDSQADYASYDSKTLGEVMAKKCADGEMSGIAKYRELNVRTNATLTNN